jgi:hypothetical protein
VRRSSALALPATSGLAAGHRRTLSKLLFVGGTLPLFLLFAAFGHLAWQSRELPSPADVATFFRAAQTMLVAGGLLLVAGFYERARARRPSGLLR